MDAGFFRVSAGPVGPEGGRAARRPRRGMGTPPGPAAGPCWSRAAPRGAAVPPRPRPAQAPRRGENGGGKRPRRRGPGGPGGIARLRAGLSTGGSSAVAPGAALPGKAPSRALSGLGPGGPDPRGAVSPLRPPSCDGGG